MITRCRFILIRIGKIAPFFLCALVCLSYLEDLYALFTESYIEFEDGVYLNKPISWFIGGFFEYELPTLLALIILSVAIETCIWNKLACVYLALNLLQKSIFADVEFETEYYCVIAAINALIAALLVYKGVRQVLIK